MPGRVLIVSESFPPFNEIASKRFGTLAPHFEANGWEPWVLTTRGDGPLPSVLPNHRVHRVSDHPREGQFGQLRQTRGWRRVVKSSLRTVVRGTGFRFNTYYPSGMRWARAVAASRKEICERIPKCDLVVGTYSPYAALVVASRMAKIWDVPWIADFRDLAARRPDDANALSRWADSRRERRAVRTASALLTVSQTLREIAEEDHGLRAHVIYNGWTYRQRIRTETSSSDAGIVNDAIYYAGLVYKHQLPSFHLVMQSLATRPDIRLVIRSLGPETLERQLLLSAEQLGVQRQVQLLPPCDPAKVERETANSLANLVVENLDRTQLASRGTLTGKLLKLVAVPPPVLAVARSDSDIGPVLGETRKGRLCSSVSEIDEFLRADVNAFPGNETAIQRYSMASQARMLCRIFDEIAPATPSLLRSAA